MNLNEKIVSAFSEHLPDVTVENVFIPKHGVNKATAKRWWMKRGSFNGSLFDRVCEAKLVETKEK